MKKAGAVVVAAAPLSSFAAGLDFSGVTAAVDISTVAAAIIAMAAIKILPNVAKWAGNKLANFF